MGRHKPTTERSLWAEHAAEWRVPEQVVSGWREADRTDPGLLRFETYGDWWPTLARERITLIATREHEHLVFAMSVHKGTPQVSFMPIPHPSGVSVDREQSRVYVASTRNPNQVFEFRPAIAALHRLDIRPAAAGRTLLPVASTFYPGCLYLHDLAHIGGSLHGNAVGRNAIVHLGRDGDAALSWWPRCVERKGRPLLGRNYIQMNSIASGPSIADSFFSASSDRIGRRRPGDPQFPVDGRGVVFAGRTREPIVRGLTRPHSARLSNGALWVLNSGYGEMCVCDPATGSYTVVAKAPGWTRGLCFHGDVAFVGTSRVIPRFRRYAPGLDPRRSLCGVHAVDTRTGAFLGGLIWHGGHQLFAVDWIDAAQTPGFPFVIGRRREKAQTRDLFYSFDMTGTSNSEVS